MTWTEAVDAMRNGKKVKCYWWFDDCYIFIGEFNQIVLSEKFASVVYKDDVAKEIAVLLQATLHNDWEIAE